MPWCPGDCRSTSRPRCSWPGPGRSTSPRRRSRSSRRSPCTSRRRPFGSRTSTGASTTSATMASSRTSSRARISRRGGRASSWAAGPRCPSGLPTPSSPRWRRVGWSRRGWPTSRPPVTTAYSRSPGASTTSRRPGGGSSGSGPRSRGPTCSVRFATGLAPSLIAPLEINRARAELQSLRQASRSPLRDWRVASARLAEVLLLEPATLLEPIEPPFLQVTLVPPSGLPRN